MAVSPEVVVVALIYAALAVLLKVAAIVAMC